MTQRDWLVSTDAREMGRLLYTKKQLTARQCRLFAIGCLLSCDVPTISLEEADAFETGKRCPAVRTIESDEDVMWFNSWTRAQWRTLSFDNGDPRPNLLRCVFGALDPRSYRAVDCDGCNGDGKLTHFTNAGDGRFEAVEVHCKRCLGTGWTDAWLPWLSDDVRRMAQCIYIDRDWTSLPVLADALTDAGCPENVMLRHLRKDTVHTRGCWVLDGIRGY